MKCKFPLKLKNSGSMGWLCLHHSPGPSLMWSFKVFLYSVSMEGDGKMSNLGLQSSGPGTSAYPHLCDITISSNTCFSKVPLQVFQIFCASSYPLLHHIPSPSQKPPGRNSSSSASPVPHSPCSPITTNELPFFLSWASAWSCHSSWNHPSPPLYFSKFPFYKHLPISGLPFYKIFFLTYTLLSNYFSIPIFRWLYFLTCSSLQSPDSWLLPSEPRATHLFIARFYDCFSRTPISNI